MPTAAAAATLVPALLSCAVVDVEPEPGTFGIEEFDTGLPAAGALPPAVGSGLSLSLEAFAVAPATVNAYRPPLTIARAVTVPLTSIVGVRVVAAVPSASVSSPIAARVVRFVLLIAIAMPAPIALLCATPPAQLIC